MEPKASRANVDQEAVSRYFSDNASRWVFDGYEEHGYNYPLAKQRNRIVLEQVARRFPAFEALKTLDLGCGGGNLALELAGRGADAVGADQSPEMLAQCEAARQRAEAGLGRGLRVEFVRSSVDGFASPHRFDVVTAMGLIGYLNDDGVLFAPVAAHLKPGGLFLVSCRNRLLNLHSVGPRTRGEAERGSIAGLVADFEATQRSASFEAPALASFVDRLEGACARARTRLDAAPPAAAPEPRDAAPYSMPMEARQHTPEEIAASGRKHGLTLEAMVGVHPHLLPPGLERAMPPGFYSALSESLLAFEETPAALLWSSAFIAVFRRG